MADFTANAVAKGPGAQSADTHALTQNRVHLQVHPTIIK